MLSDDKCDVLCHLLTCNCIGTSISSSSQRPLLPEQTVYGSPKRSTFQFKPQDMHACSHHIPSILPPSLQLSKPLKQWFYVLINYSLVQFPKASLMRYCELSRVLQQRKYVFRIISDCILHYCVASQTPKHQNTNFLTFCCCSPPFLLPFHSSPSSPFYAPIFPFHSSPSSPFYAPIFPFHSSPSSPFYAPIFPFHPALFPRSTSLFPPSFRHACIVHLSYINFRHQIFLDVHR